MTTRDVSFIEAVICIAVAIFLYSNPANATERNPLTGAVSTSNAQSGSWSGGGYLNNDNDAKMSASSAIAPSVGTNNNCLIATPSSKAASILIFSASGTTGFHYSGLCLAYKMENFELVEQLMCLEDKNFAKLNPKCKK
jgi:hypothetical protein